MSLLKAKWFLFVGIAVLAFSPEGAAEVTVGQKAPDFTLTDTYGKSRSLSDYQGKFVVLEWVNHDCPFVRKHYESRNMQKLQETYTRKDVVWLSIGSSAPGLQGYFSPEEWNKLTQKKGAMPTAVLLDPDGQVGRMYRAQTTPHMFIVNPSGALIYQVAIDDTPSTDPADIPQSKNYVQSALDAALEGNPIETPSTKSYGCSVKYAN